MTRHLVVIECDDERTREHLFDVARSVNTLGMRCAAQRWDLEDDDSILKLSVAKDAIAAGMSEIVERSFARTAAPAREFDLSEIHIDQDLELAPADPPVPWQPSPEYLAERAATRAAERAAKVLAGQASRRAELERFDAAADAERRRRADRYTGTERCPGGCSRGGDGPACGRPGCDG